MRGHVVWILLLITSVAGLMAQQEHRIREGESLWTIARKYEVSVESLKEANNLESDVIWEGRMLTIPERPRESPVVPERPAGHQEEPIASAQEVATPRSGRDQPSATLPEMDPLRLQVLLDRAGFGPGVIDGKIGYFTRKALELCQQWNPEALSLPDGPVTQVLFDSAWRAYVDRSLPGTGDSPDFKALTREKRPLMYATMAELIAERYHCGVSLLKKLNPELNFERLPEGQAFLVPNVRPFEIEDYLSPEAEGQWTGVVGKGPGGRRIEISKKDRFLYLLEGERVLRAFPVTINAAETPQGVRSLGTVVPGPVYERLKTGLDLLAGPNSPVGIVWCPLGDGYGIHGTSNPDSIGRSVSSGCIRLSNWDAVHLAAMIRKGETVSINE
ncbi:MAG: LysM peptidoglycan-binding domain-containing protein [Verrucomicrobiota bacterium JB023]|nr:LysM peptidoglycan-binding domain-containing protein [Verrucomicrobiota bacterium JB023]